MFFSCRWPSFYLLYFIFIHFPLIKDNHFFGTIYRNKEGNLYLLMNCRYENIARVNCQLCCAFQTRSKSFKINFRNIVLILTLAKKTIASSSFIAVTFILWDWLRLRSDGLLNTAGYR